MDTKTERTPYVFHVEIDGNIVELSFCYVLDDESAIRRAADDIRGDAQVHVHVRLEGRYVAEVATDRRGDVYALIVSSAEHGLVTNNRVTDDGIIVPIFDEFIQVFSN